MRTWHDGWLGEYLLDLRTSSVLLYAKDLVKLGGVNIFASATAHALAAHASERKSAELREHLVSHTPIRTPSSATMLLLVRTPQNVVRSFPIVSQVMSYSWF